VLGVISCACGILGLFLKSTILLSGIGLITGIIGCHQANAVLNVRGADISLFGIIVSALVIGLSFLSFVGRLIDFGLGW
jgi:hypothetical protein